MNHLQLLAFLIFAFATLLAGLWFMSLMKLDDKLMRSKCLVIGEAILLGGILYSGAAVYLSIIYQYNALALWSTVALAYLFLVNKDVRARLKGILPDKSTLDLPHLGLVALLVVFFLRNCYFLVDVDSHAVYLYAQKLWLEYGTSIFASKALDHQTYIPMFDFLPTALGISVWGKESLFFCQLINFFWRFSAILVVYGYIRYRFNGFYALAAAMLVLFNDHFFTSGANQWVLINGAVIAFLSAVAYNFWESRAEDNPQRLLLAGIFLSQVITNKIALVFSFILIFLFCAGILKNPFQKLREIFKDRSLVLALLIAVFVTLLWFVKNYLATGLPTFPILAWKTHALGWTTAMAETSREVFRGTSVTEFLKYMTYLMIWPGVHPLKLVCLTIIFMPFIAVFSIQKPSFEKEALLELGYWVGMSFLILFGICLASHQDPRYFRYPMGVCAIASVFCGVYIFKYCLNIRNGFVISCALLVMALPGYRIMIHNGGGEFRRASIEDNLKVLADKMHFEDVIERHYPQNVMVDKDYAANCDKVPHSAWLVGNQPRTPSAFLAPTRPQVGLWVTTVINWHSYDDPDKIARDLREAGIKYIMINRGNRLAFEPIEEFAKEATTFKRYPETIFYPYDRPEELIKTKFKK